LFLKNNDNITPLTISIVTANSRIIQLLLEFLFEKGVDLYDILDNAVNSISQIRRDSIPLHIGACLEQEMFKSLNKSALRRGVSLNEKDCF